MAGSIQLSLLIGPGMPVPALADVVNALDSVQVTSSTDSSGFQLSFKIGKRSLLETTLLPAGYFDPIITRVIIIATVNGLPNVLMDGVVTRQEISPSNDVGKSTLTITGEDLSRMMDLVEMPFMRFPAMPVVARVYAILGKYAVLGIAPVAIPPIVPDMTNPLEELPSQNGTDLAYIRQLAYQCGYVFYVEPGPLPGSSIAYFGPDIRIPAPQPALNVNMDALTNVESLSFSLDGTAKKIVVITIMDPVTKKIPLPIPLPNINILRPPMGARPTMPSKLEFAEGMAALGPIEAANFALRMLLSANDSVTGSGSLDVLRYGRVLRSRMMVGVRGAGLAYDGLYYVNSVTHNIKHGEYKQNFNLSRDGLISNTPAVLP
ncbi:hypothetical protein C2U70_15980 [Bradyrhizobium guangdongense]|uniref:hypothetical protein n=1 Tax=Bradyrhizobium guangdongense TaxID=1325090 RepID=UPI00112DEEAF|nr:hypothetical protein [Bradyrhizobium guangdongense]TPQ34849.1 hypothetical protein C2U70_15980 [Bradyrhizobium guangdongense]